MAAKLNHTVYNFLTLCPHVLNVHDLLTKIRIELAGGYVLDLFYNEATARYAYALIKDGQRIVGWDNAPHYPQLTNFPHHFHAQDGSVIPSVCIGDPEHDIHHVAKVVNPILESQ